MRLVWIFSVVFLAGVSVAAATAKIEAIGGGETVNVKRGVKTLTLKTGGSLAAGDELTTAEGQAVDIRFPNRMIVRVGRSTVYRIGEKPGASTRDRLLKGFLRVLAPEPKAGKERKIRFELSTPTGTIGVRGTEFVVSHTEERTNVKTLHGAVLLGPDKADFKDMSRFVVLLRGHESDIGKGEKEPARPKSFSLEDYLYLLNHQGDGNPFAALADRRAGMRTEKVAKQEKKVRPESKRDEMAKDITPPARGGPAKPDANSTANELEILTQDLIQAVKNDDVETVEKSLEKVGGSAVRLKTGDTILHLAAVYNAQLTIQYLVDYGLGIDTPNPAGETALMYVAAKTGAVDTALLLIQNRADPTLVNGAGHTALELARSSGHAELTKFLEQEIKVREGK